MKKVLFVATVTRHINAFHIPYLKWFKEQGYEVHVASNGEEKMEYCDKHYNLPFERFPIKKNNLKTYKELKKIIEGNQYEIIHCHTPVGGVLTRLAARRARKNGTRVIYTAHGFHFYKGAPLFNWIIYYPIEKICARLTDCLITINQEDYELAKKKFKANQIELVHGVGVDKSKFDFQMSEEEKLNIRKSFGLNKEDFVLIQVAELNKNKNQIMAIEAMRELVKENKNYKLFLVGKGALEKYYKDKVKEYNLGDNIIFTGYRKDVQQILKISNLGLSCSIREGLGLNLVEEIYSGLPCIATINRGHVEILEKEQLVKINDINELKNKINKIYNNELLTKKDLHDYEINNVIKEVQKIYQIVGED